MEAAAEKLKVQLEPVGPHPSAMQGSSTSSPLRVGVDPSEHELRTARGWAQQEAMTGGARQVAAAGGARRAAVVVPRLRLGGAQWGTVNHRMGELGCEYCWGLECVFLLQAPTF
jgi:hypothetical protein